MIAALLDNSTGMGGQLKLYAWRITSDLDFKPSKAENQDYEKRYFHLQKESKHTMMGHECVSESVLVHVTIPIRSFG